MGARVVGSVLVLVLAGASYAWVIALPLTGIDSIPTIAAAHVESVWELPSVLVRELRGGAQQGGAYYRPLTLLTYGVESLLWEWSARGHHATDLACHALAALAIFWMGRLAFGLGVPSALAAVALFLLHPAVNEVVPAVSRRQEPLLVIALAITLIGAARVPARHGGALLLLGSVAAVCAVERGLVVPGIVFAYLLFQRPGAAGIGARLRRALLWTLPAFGVALGFYALRATLFGSGGIVFEPDRAVRIFTQYVLQLIHPQQLFDLQAPTTNLGAVAWLAVAVVAAASAGWIFSRSERKGTLLFSLAWIVGYGLLFSIAGQGQSWYPYTAVPALGLLLVTVAAEGASAARRGTDLARGAWALAGVAAIAIPLIWTSPALQRYPAWKIAGGLSERFLTELSRVVEEIPPEATPVIINLPGHYRENDSQLRVTRSAAILWPRSIDAWKQVNGIEREIVVLGAAEFVSEVSTPEIAFRDEAGAHRVAISFGDGPSAYKAPDRQGTSITPLENRRGFEFPLDALPAEQRYAIFVFDGERLQPY